MAIENKFHLGTFVPSRAVPARSPEWCFGTSCMFHDAAETKAPHVAQNMV